jgi:hypothetical protein
MSFRSTIAESPVSHRAIVLAGLAGATAEVLWIGLFCALTPLRGEEVLRQITATISPALAGSGWAPVLGLLLHFVLGVVVAYAFSVLIWQTFARRRGGGTTLTMALLALTAIWAVNFFVLLPAINGEFVGLMPYTLTLGSKVLFAIAMAATLNSFDLESHASAPASTRAEVTDPLQILY